MWCFPIPKEWPNHYSKCQTQKDNGWSFYTCMYVHYTYIDVWRFGRRARVYSYVEQRAGFLNRTHPYTWPKYVNLATLATLATLAKSVWRWSNRDIFIILIAELLNQLNEIECGPDFDIYQLSNSSSGCNRIARNHVLELIEWNLVLFFFTLAHNDL